MGMKPYYFLSSLHLIHRKTDAAHLQKKADIKNMIYCSTLETFISLFFTY